MKEDIGDRVMYIYTFYRERDGSQMSAQSVERKWK